MMALSRAVTIVLTGLLLLAGSGCSTGLKLGYNQLERLARWEIDREIDLDAAQKAAFTAEFQALQRWHRQTQLPRYAADLRLLAAAIERGQPLGSAVDAALAAAEIHSDALWQQAQPGTERLLATLADVQVAEYDRRRRKALDKQARRHADDSPDDRRKHWRREWRDSLDRWIGALNAQQLALLDAAWPHEQTLERSPAEQAAVRLARHQRLVAGLASRREPGLLVRLTAAADPQERVRSEADRARARALLITLLNAADQRQRDRLQATVQELADDLAQLSRPDSAATATTTAR